MSKEDIAEKYGVELIGKEMWVWDEEPKKAFFSLVVRKRLDQVNYPYGIANGDSYKNASDTNPNKPKKPQVGDKGYFWDDDKVSYAYSTLIKIDNTPIPFYSDCFYTWFSHFSTEKQPWMQ